MILQALNAYYQRRAAEEGADIPLRGFSRQPVPFALEIEKDGTLKQVLDLRTQQGKKLVARQMILPQAIKRTVGIAANFLWDNTGYVLGADAKGNPERSAKTHDAFLEKVHLVCGSLDDAGAKAVLAFLDQWDPKEAPGLEYWDEMSGLNLVFKLSSEKNCVHERPLVRDAWLAHYFSGEPKPEGQCLVTGDIGPVARLHADIKGVRGAQSKGASLVAFNLDAFTSYDKTQSYNAPVGEEAAFNYTTALNDLLKSGSDQRVQIGDATTVFWTESPTRSEELLGWVLDPREDKGDQKVLGLFLEAIRDGKMPDEFKPEKDVRFWVLGLSPNASRLSVRFWHVDTVAGLWGKIGRHFESLRMVRAFESEPQFPSMWQLLRVTAKRQDLDNLSPLLAGAFTRAILTGGPYPESLLSAVLGRIKAESEIGYFRAALIKACLVRNHNLEVPVSLDESSLNTAYRLGRLFAVLEKLQQEAIPGANATIKDRYFGSAMATPRAVFPVLLRLAQHHGQKIEYGYAYDRRIAEILEEINVGEGGFPAHLPMEEQGNFVLGYYQQRTRLWTKKAAADTPEAPKED
jgi:CRISPR-associated protein Csd1